jgi:hypothetical protein
LPRTIPPAIKPTITRPKPVSTPPAITSGLSICRGVRGGFDTDESPGSTGGAAAATSSRGYSTVAQSSSGAVRLAAVSRLRT